MQPSARLLVLPVRWRDVALPLPSGMPAQARRWIRLDTSMTRALGRRFGAGIRVVVRCDGPGMLLPDEARLLGTRKARGQVREVVLRIGECSLLVARTVHASRRLRAHAALASLGSRPLGELLFTNGTPRRRQRQYAPVALRRAMGSSQHCWARRTVYLYERQRLLVTEIFLPAMFAAS
jgi:chorismate--pyruvate lyase